MQNKTPGVYIVEQDAFPNTVVAVATAIPVFIGYTEKASDGPLNKAGMPTCIGSMADYARVFGGPPVPRFSLTPSAAPQNLRPKLDQRFFLYHGVSLYFMNGGGPAYVISVGTFAGVAANGIRASDFSPQADPSGHTEAPFAALEKLPDVTLIVAPDTTLLPSADDCYTFWRAALQHCNTTQKRMALIDIYNGASTRTGDARTDVISGATHGLRAQIGTNFLNYGAAYYPWLNFDVVDATTITYDNLDDVGLATLVTALDAELTTMNPPPAQPMQASMEALYKRIGQRLAADVDSRMAPIARNHTELLQVSPLYRRLVANMLAQANLLPPGCAMAGVYAHSDAEQGVWHAPANTGIVGAVSPALQISEQDQEDLNVPLDGRAVNAIRNIPSRGLVVWGARTLDGNSADWRYINVRRTLIMLEQSIKVAVSTYMFAPNAAATWVAVQSMISDFLTTQWKNGALAGADTKDAFDVQAGLGSTMTGDDLQNGYMNVLVRVAIVHPAEFIELTFQQQMQVS